MLVYPFANKASSYLVFNVSYSKKETGRPHLPLYNYYNYYNNYNYSYA